MRTRSIATMAGILAIGAAGMVAAPAAQAATAPPANKVTVRPHFTVPEVVSISVNHVKPATLYSDGSSYVKVSAAVAAGTYGLCSIDWWRWDSDSGWIDYSYSGTTAFTDYLERGKRYEYWARPYDCLGNYGDGFYGPTFGRQVYDNTASGFSYSAGWSNVSNANAYAGSYRQATGVGKTISYYSCFYGFAPIVTTQPGGAKLDVYVGGIKKGTINTNSGSVQYRRLITGFGSGNPNNYTCDTITLRVASAGKVGFDALLVHTS